SAPRGGWGEGWWSRIQPSMPGIGVAVTADAGAASRAVSASDSASPASGLTRRGWLAVNPITASFLRYLFPKLRGPLRGRSQARRARRREADTDDVRPTGPPHHRAPRRVVGGWLCVEKADQRPPVSQGGLVCRGVPPRQQP